MNWDGRGRRFQESCQKQDGSLIALTCVDVYDSMAFRFGNYQGFFFDRNERQLSNF